jgi:hypothetical protein
VDDGVVERAEMEKERAGGGVTVEDSGRVGGRGEGVRE